MEANGPELVVTEEMKERERKGVLRRSTRRVGAFEYRLQQPGELDTHEIKAEMQDGVLSITVPKAEAARPRRVRISESVTAAVARGRRPARQRPPAAVYVWHRSTRPGDCLLLQEARRSPWPASSSTPSRGP